MRSRSERRIRFFCEWMLAMADAARRRKDRPGRAAGRSPIGRRTIAALSAAPAPPGQEPPGPAPPGGGGVARNTAIFSIGTGISRIVGLLREVVFASYFGTAGRASAYTIASLVPNLVAQLFAQSALSAAFVPVFTDLLQKGRRRGALSLASTLFWIMLIGLGPILMGMNRPVHLVARGAEVEEIVHAVAIAVVDARESEPGSTTPEVTKSIAQAD